MKSLIFVIISTLSFSALAGTSEAIRAVLDQPEVKGLVSIRTIDVTNTYKCLQCYDISVSGERQGFAPGSTRPGILYFRTEGDVSTFKVKVDLIGETK